MPVFNNIPGAIKQELLNPVALSESPALLRSQIRNIGNSAAKSASYISYIRQEFRSLIKPKENGLSGLVATNKTDDIEIQIVGNPIPKIIFGGTEVDIAVVFNQDAFRIVLEKDASGDGATVEAWILAVVPYAAFDKLPFGGFLIYLIRRIDDIMVQTSALQRYATKLTKLPVNSIGVGRHSTAQERPEEAGIANGTPAVAPAAPVAPSAPAPKAAPEPVAEVEPATEPAPEQVAEAPEPPVEEEPAPEDVDKEDENYKAAASFALNHNLRDAPAAPSKPFEPVGSYANFFIILQNNLKEIQSFVKRSSDSRRSGSTEAAPELTFGWTRDRASILFMAHDMASHTVSIQLTPVTTLQVQGRRGPSFAVTAALGGYQAKQQTAPLGTWNWSAEYNRLNAFQIVQKIEADLIEGLSHLPKAFTVNTKAPTTMGAPTTAAPAQATASDEISAKIAEIKSLFSYNGEDNSYAESLDDLDVELHSDIQPWEKRRAIGRMQTQMHTDRNEHWVDSETGSNDDEEAELKQQNDQLLRDATGKLSELAEIVCPLATSATYKEPKETPVKHPSLPEEVKEPKVKAEVNIYKKKLEELRKKTNKTGTNESAYKKLDVDTDPKVKQDKVKEIKVPKVEETLPTTVGEKAAEIGAEVPKAEKPKNVAKMPKGFEAKANLEQHLNEVAHESGVDPVQDANESEDIITLTDGEKAVLVYTGSLWNVWRRGKGNLGSGFNKKDAINAANEKLQATASYKDSEELKIGDYYRLYTDPDGDGVEVGSLEELKGIKSLGLLKAIQQYDGKNILTSPKVAEAPFGSLTQGQGPHGLPPRNRDVGFALAGEFDEDYTASEPSDLEDNDEVKDFVNVDKNLNNPDEVAEGAKDTETPAAPADSAEDETKVDINTALKFRVVTSGAEEGAEVTIPKSLDGVLEAFEEASLPNDIVIFVTSGEGLTTLVTSKFRDGKGVRVYSSELLVPERAAGASKDEKILKVLKDVAAVQDDRASALRQIDSLFDAYETLVTEDSFVAENFDDTDDDAVYGIPDQVEDIRKLFESLANPAKEEEETENEGEEADAAFASSLMEILAHKPNPVVAAAQVGAIISSFGDNAEAAFSAIESAGLFASASSFPVMETKWYKRGNTQHAVHHMSVASADQQTLMFIPRIGAYAVASLDELQAEEARG